jgi:RNA polymerase sigma-70 factor, ECF subfamily
MNLADQFETIVCEHYEPLFRFAMSLTRSESDAWDLTQQTFYVWASKGHQLHDFSKVKTWLYTTLHRAFLQARRKHVRFPHHDLEEVAEQLPASSPELADQVDSSQVLSALERVDEVYQAAVALFYLEDCSYRDIAEILAVPVGTVKSRIARGILQLRRILIPDGPSAPSPAEDKISFTAVAHESAAPETVHSPPRPAAPGHTAERWEDAWDLSSTRLGEPFGAL